MCLGHVLVIPLLAIIAFTKNLTAVYAALLPLSFALLGPYSSFVVLGQSYLAKNIGFASGVTLGISMSVGGIVAPILGRIADMQGVAAVMQILTGFSILCAAATFLLPGRKEKTAKEGD